MVSNPAKYTSDSTYGQKERTPRCVGRFRLSSQARRGVASLATSTRRSVAKVDAAVLQNDDAQVFTRHEPVLFGQMHHFTTLESRTAIENDGFLRGGPSSSMYDGRLEFPDAPPTAYFAVQPATDGVFYPFSFYPQHAEENTETACVSVDLSRLLDDGYSMFYSNSTAARVGAATRVHTHMVFTTSKYLDFAQRNFIAVSKFDNPVLRFVNEEPHVATRISADVFDSIPVAKPLPIPSSNDAHETSAEATHTAAVVIMGDLPLIEDSYLWRKTFRLGKTLTGRKQVAKRQEVSNVRAATSPRVAPYLLCPLCQRAERSLVDLKAHYRASHTDVRFSCPEQGCDFTARHSHNLNEHVRAKHTGTKYQCHLCSHKTSYAQNLTLHVRRKHPDAPKLRCSEHATCHYSTLSQVLLDKHMQTKHSRPRIKCSNCDFSSPNERQMAKHRRFCVDGGMVHCPHDACDYSSKWRSALRTHLKWRHAEGRILCPVAGCEHWAISSAKINAHIRSAHVPKSLEGGTRDRVLEKASN